MATVAADRIVHLAQHPPRTSAALLLAPAFTTDANQRVRSRRHQRSSALMCRQPRRRASPRAESCPCPRRKLRPKTQAGVFIPTVSGHRVGVQARSGPTDYSVNAAACVQVTARSSSAFFSSSVLDWRDHCSAFREFEQNSSDSRTKHDVFTRLRRLPTVLGLPLLRHLFQLRPRPPGVPALLKLRLGLVQGRHAI